MARTNHFGNMGVYCIIWSAGFYRLSGGGAPWHGVSNAMNVKRDFDSEAVP